MTEEKRPGGLEPIRSANILEGQDKDTPKLSKRQRNVANLLRAGKHSAAGISIALGYSDPRSYIRDLREKGINVHDEWVGHEDTRFKRYWI